MNRDLAVRDTGRKRHFGEVTQVKANLGVSEAERRAVRIRPENS